MSFKKTLVVLPLVFVFGYVLQVLYIPGGSLTFGYDQARDAFVTRHMLSGDFKILGPPSSTPGLHHGVFYNYLLLVPHLVGKDPRISAYWIALLNALTVFVVYYFGYLVTKKRVIGVIIAAILFAFSFEASQYAAWLSNPTIGVWTVPLIYLGLWAWLSERKKWGPIVAGLGLGLSVQANIFLAYHTWPVLLWLLVKRKNIGVQGILKLVASFLLAVSTMVVSELKFGGRGVLGLRSLFFRDDDLVGSKRVSDFVFIFFDQLGDVFAHSLLPSAKAYGALMVVVTLGYLLLSWKKGEKRNLFSWQLFFFTYLVAHVFAVPFGGSSTPFIGVGIGSGLAVVFAIIFYDLLGTRKAVAGAAILVIMAANVSAIISTNKNGQTIFSIQKDMLLSKQLKAIDFTYQESDSGEFGINTITSPLWINIVWTYLYEWHGYGNYGYVPAWHGTDQVGKVATLPKVNERTESFFDF